MRDINDFNNNLNKHNTKIGALVSFLLVVLGIKDFFSAAAGAETFIIFAFVGSYWLIMKFIKRRRKFVLVLNYLYSIMLCTMIISLVLFNNAFLNLTKLFDPDPYKYQDIMAKGMLAYTNDDFIGAAQYFKKASKYDPGDIQKDISLYRADSLVRAGKQDQAYEVMSTYLKNNPGQSNNEDLRLLSVQKLINLYAANDYNQLAAISKSFSDQSEFQLYVEFEMVALALGSETEKLNQLFDSRVFGILETDMYRDIQRELWGCLYCHYVDSNDYIRALIALTIIESTSPEQFQKELFTDFYQIGNLRLFSLENKKVITDEYDNLIKNARIINSDLFEKYEEAIIEFGLQIGSVEGLKYFCKENFNASETELLSEVEKVLIDEKSFTFKILDCDNKKIILWICTTTFKEEGALSGRINEFKYRIIKEDNNKDIIFEDLKFLTSKGLTTHAIEVLSWPNSSGKFILKEKQGSGEYINFTFIDIKKKQKQSIEFDESVSYHSMNEQVKYDEKSNKIYLQWNFEVQDYSKANIERKVVGIALAEINENGNSQNVTVSYLNPAVQFFQNLNPEEIKLSKYLLDQVVLSNKKIINSEFEKLISQDYSLNYQRTMIDDIFARFSEDVAPKVSAMRITLNNWTEVDNASVGSNQNNEFLVLVQKENTKIKILNIYTINDGKLGDKVLKN